MSDLATLVKTSLVDVLEGLRDEVRKLTEPLTEKEFWTRPLEPGNSVGHLVLHLTGNLSHFAGAQLGGTGYVRDREREFTETNLPSKTAAMADLDSAVATFRRVVAALPAARLTDPHPETRFGNVTKALLSLVTHFALHRGQISYIVRLVRQGGQ
jgi:uncharacterized damage-inducible protein DinB